MNLNEQVPPEETTSSIENAEENYSSKSKMEPFRNVRMELRKIKNPSEPIYIDDDWEDKNDNQSKKSFRPATKGKYQSLCVKKTVKDTIKTLPSSPEGQAEVLAKLAEQALAKLQSLPKLPKRNILRRKSRKQKRMK